MHCLSDMMISVSFEAYSFPFCEWYRLYLRMSCSNLVSRLCGKPGYEARLFHQATNIGSDTLGLHACSVKSRPESLENYDTGEFIAISAPQLQTQHIYSLISMCLCVCAQWVNSTHCNVYSGNESPVCASQNGRHGHFYSIIVCSLVPRLYPCARTQTYQSESALKPRFLIGLSTSVQVKPGNEAKEFDYLA